jgi:hypothetical protein
MTNRPSPLVRNRPSLFGRLETGNRGTASRQLPARAPVTRGARPARAAAPRQGPTYGKLDLRKATGRWLADGKAQGWSPPRLRHPLRLTFASALQAVWRPR